MKILAITGKVAEPEVRKVVSDLDHDIYVYVMPVTVAAFLTPRIVAEQLKDVSLTDYDMILLPGTITGHVKVIEDVTGIPCFKGPVHASEIPLALDPGISLSKVHPANILLRDKLRENALSEIEYVEDNWKNVLFWTFSETVETTAARRGVDRWEP